MFPIHLHRDSRYSKNSILLNEEEETVAQITGELYVILLSVNVDDDTVRSMSFPITRIPTELFPTA